MSAETPAVETADLSDLLLTAAGGMMKKLLHDSTVLNYVGFRMAEALGDVGPEDNQIECDPSDLVERLIEALALAVEARKGWHQLACDRAVDQGTAENALRVAERRIAAVEAALDSSEAEDSAAPRDEWTGYIGINDVRRALNA